MSITLRGTCMYMHVMSLVSWRSWNEWFPVCQLQVLCHLSKQTVWDSRARSGHALPTYIVCEAQAHILGITWLQLYAGMYMCLVQRLVILPPGSLCYFILPSMLNTHTHSLMHTNDETYACTNTHTHYMCTTSYVTFHLNLLKHIELPLSVKSML